jgi:cell division protease FtsH
MLVFNTAMNGSSQDLDRAARLARDMVFDYGMSPTIGPRVFPGKLSQKNRHLINQEIGKFLLDAYNAAYTMLSENRDKLDCIANALLAKETLSAKEVYALLGMNQPTKNIQ